MRSASIAGVVAMLAAAWPAAVLAEVEEEDWNAKFQSTYVFEKKTGFDAPYTGPNSLGPRPERSYSFTATAALGGRTWQGGEIYADAECAQGVPLANLTGLGGITNGELARTSGPTLTCYRARLFVRHTWGLGGEREAVESDANQLAGMVDRRRVVLTIGNYSVIDIFDDNTYNHDPRTQFLNWSLYTHGAYDYAADSRGYTWGATLEYFDAGWALRAGRFIQPKLPNQLQLDHRFFVHYGDQVELERSYAIAGQSGKVRLLAFRSSTRMSRFRDALALGEQTGEVPDINLVRNADQWKYGFGVNVEHALSDDIGLFTRASWADGATETYAFTEIDRSVTGGALVKGTRWNRNDDTVGIAFAQNMLSAARRDYLAAGGISFFIGDGRLAYRPERLIEAFYSAALFKGAFVSLDYQYIRNPAYNSDRGPVNVFGARLHVEF